MLGSSRLFHAFAMATPGMRELLSIGKVWELAQLERRTERRRRLRPRGRGLSRRPGTASGILRTPRTFAEIARVGPIAHQGRAIAATIADPEFTGVVAVATPEEMPVNETLWLRDALAEDELALDAVIVNALYPERFDGRRAGAARAGPRRRSRSPLVGAALSAALSEHERAVAPARAVRAPARRARLPLVQLPYLFAEQLGPAELERLADALDTGLSKLEPAAVSR